MIHWLTFANMVEVEARDVIILLTGQIQTETTSRVSEPLPAGRLLLHYDRFRG